MIVFYEVLWTCLIKSKLRLTHISKKMIACGGANEEGTVGYCKMHDFSCAAEKTCLTYAPGGPKK